MGLQDRDYYREDADYDDGENVSGGGMSAVMMIILLNVGIWLANGFFFAPPPGMVPNPDAPPTLTEMMELRPNDIYQPLQWYRLITCGFAHADGYEHIFSNMLGLFFLGPYVERRYGKKEFWWFYMTAILIGSLCWVATGLLTDKGAVACVGASGAVCAVVILFAFNFPHVKLLLFFIIPMPAWLAGVLLILWDMFGAAEGSSNVAHGVHLAGAAFGTLYYLTRFRFTGLFHRGPGGWTRDGNYYDHPHDGGPDLGGSRVRQYDPDEDDSYGYARRTPTAEEQRAEQEFRRLEQEVEILLRKISQQGMESLTPEERQKLQEASRMYRSRR